MNSICRASHVRACIAYGLFIVGARCRNALSSVGIPLKRGASGASDKRSPSGEGMGLGNDLLRHLHGELEPRGTAPRGSQSAGLSAHDMNTGFPESMSDGLNRLPSKPRHTRPDLST